MPGSPRLHRLVWIVIGAVFTWAGIGKLLVPRREVVLLPGGVIADIARWWGEYTLGVMEAGLGFLLCVGVLPVLTSSAAAGLLAVYSVWLSAQILLGHGTDECGCLPLLHLSNHAALIRNIVLLTVALVAFPRRQRFERYGPGYD